MQESGRSEAIARRRSVLNRRSRRVEAVDDMHCNQVADPVYAAARRIEAFAPDRLRVSGKIEQTYADLGTGPVLRDRQIDQIIEVHTAKLMLAHDATRRSRIRRHPCNRLESA